MSRRTWIRRAGAIALTILVVTLSASPLPATAHGPFDPVARPASREADLARALGAGGVFRGASGVVGIVNTRAWTLVGDIAAGQPPRFASRRAAAAAPTGPWGALGSNGSGDGAINNGVLALAVSGTNLYVGGSFTNAAGIATADHVARWDGSTWSALGSNGAGDGALNADVFALAVSGTDLYVGGGFQNAAGIATADFVAKWSGATWSGLGSNGSGNGALNGEVLALAVSGTDVYAGGNFSNAAGMATADQIARWNGSAWSGLGSNGSGDGALGADAYVDAFAVSGTNLYVGGGFTDVAGIAAADYVAGWNGTAWFALGSHAGDGALNSDVYALAVSGTDLYVGGSFFDARGIAAADNIAKWSGSAWSALGSNGSNDGAIGGNVFALAVSGTDLYVGGLFSNAANIAEADDVAKWSGTDWSALGSNGSGNGALASNAQAIAVYGQGIDVGGWFSDAAGIATADYIARWTFASVHVPGDYNGDGTTDMAVFRPGSGATQGTWYVRGVTNAQWGVSTDIPVPGDYDGNGTTDLAVFRPGSGATQGYWYIAGQTNIQWGTSTDIPVPSDYDGNGTTDIAVFRPSTGVWYVRNVTNAEWGTAGDIPVPGDYDGNGTTDMAVFRPGSGATQGTWYIRGVTNAQWGVSTDIPVPGDYDGNGTTDLAVFRPGSGATQGTWYVRNVTNAQWGVSTDIPVPGDYDGNGATDLAVFRPGSGSTQGYWYVRNVTNAQWGVATDVPLSLPYAIRHVFFP